MVRQAPKGATERAIVLPPLRGSSYAIAPGSQGLAPLANNCRLFKAKKQGLSYVPRVTPDGARIEATPFDVFSSRVDSALDGSVPQLLR